MGRIARAGMQLAGVIAILLVGAAEHLGERADAQRVQSLVVDGRRLQQNIEEFSVFGRAPGGGFADGVSRYAYSEPDVAGRKFAMNLIRQAGVEPRIDAAGNIIAVRAGTGPGLKPIVIGSHIDSVPNGGNYDGVLGSLAAIEVLKTLNEKSVTLRHPLEVALWSNEEGGEIGSGLAVGTVDSKQLELSLNGIPRLDGIKRIGGDPDHLGKARMQPGSIEAYVELHIEQSRNLERQRVPIGVVDGIVAIDEYEAIIRGVANHAGTTPMADRRNALLAAAKLIEAVDEEVRRPTGNQVGNVGHIEVFPNVRNIVAGQAKLTIELRDLDVGKIRTIADLIKKRARRIEVAMGTSIAIRLVESDAPAIANPAIQKEIENSATALGLKYVHLRSGAGHDAANLEKIGPMGMIFVPSAGGISHSPKEFTSWADCTNGANVLLQTVMRLDRE